jgi:polysaccharide export outer membrane protein
VALTYTVAALGIPRARAQQPQVQQQALPADYRVGPGDSIFLSVPQRPDLNRELVVDADGKVTLPLIGKVQVRGLTDPEIESRLLQALREYYPSVNRTDVTITRASSNMIWVSGDVKLPGKYSFPQPVNVWEAIREAGGPATTASLDAVRIIKDRSRGGGTTIVDVQGAIETGSVRDLPTLDPGDTIIVPAKHLQAGGPSDRAKLDEVRIIRPRADGSAQTIKLDLNKFIEKGDVANNPPLQPGDTVAIGRKGFTTTELTTILAIVTTLATITLLYFTIQDEIDEQNAQ